MLKWLVAIFLIVFLMLGFYFAPKLTAKFLMKSGKALFSAGKEIVKEGTPLAKEVTKKTIKEINERAGTRNETARKNEK